MLDHFGFYCIGATMRAHMLRDSVSPVCKKKMRFLAGLRVRLLCQCVSENNFKYRKYISYCYLAPA